jgi:Flp pilus assembly protein TadD
VESAKAYAEEGRQAARAGDHASAVDFYTKAIESNPESPEAYSGRGYSSVQLRRDPEADGGARAREDGAIRDYSMAIRYNPAFADAYFNRAMLLASRARYKDAVEDLLNASRYQPRDPEPHLWLGRIYEEKLEGRVVAAMEHYEKYADLGGSDPAVREKVRLWKELRSQVVPAPARDPTAEDEKKAEELHEGFKKLFAADRKDEALKAVEELVSKYGHTRYVRERVAQFQALLNALKK